MRLPARILLTGATGYMGGRLLLRVIEEGGARRAGVRRITLSTFTYRSIIDAPVTEVFRWHEHPQALATLTPALVKIVQNHGGIRDGGRVTVSMGVGSVRMRWILRHYGYVAGRRFCDEQEQGPFAVWRHTHLFQPVGSSQTLYEDRIEWAVPGGSVLNRFARIMLHPLLRLGFAHRHRVVRTMVGGHRLGRRPTWRKWVAAGATVATAILHARGATARNADGGSHSPLSGPG